MRTVAQFLYDLKDSEWGLALQKSPLAHRLFDELGRGLLLPLLGVPVDMDVRMSLGGGRHKPVLKSSREKNSGCFSLLLIQPPMPDNLRQKRLVPIGLASLAGFLREELKDAPFNVGILDAQSQNLSIADILGMIKPGEWQAIGIGFMSCQADIARNLAKAIRANHPEIALLAGGNHPTADPGSVASSFDLIVMNEGEVTLLEWVRAKMAGKPGDDLPGTALARPDGTFVRHPDRPFEPNLDRFPDMAWDLLPVKSYDWPLHVVGGSRLPIMASRGCPYACTFCGSPDHWRRQVRYRSARRVFDEIRHLQKSYNTDYFHFKDDNFTLKKSFTEEFCDLVIEANLGITWICTDRASHIIRHKDLLPKMRQAGCIGIEIGIESADPQAYIEVNKEQEIRDTEEAIRLQRECGMVPQYTYMAFAPGETLLTYALQKQFFDTIHAGMPFPRFFQPLPFKLYLGQFATAYPNTGFHREKGKLGRDLADDPDLEHHFNITFLPFSLLEDIPVWKVNALAPVDFELFAIAIWQGFYAQFPGRLPNRRLTMRLWEASLGLASFFRNCDGTRTLMKVARRVADELNWSLDKALRLCALAANLFAQQGMVRSAIHGRDREIPVKRVEVPAFKRRIIRFLIWKYAPMSFKTLAQS